MSKNFLSVEPSLEDCWRAIILFGKNTAAYKFALANSLLHFCDLQKDEIEAEDFAIEFSKHICNHLRSNDKQGTNPSNTFLEVCRSFNKNEIGVDSLVDETIRVGFRYVFDAFHNVAGGRVPVAFFTKGSNKKSSILLHDDIFKMLENNNYQDFMHENEARWSLVETAWRLNLNPNLIALNYYRISSLTIF